MSHQHLQDFNFDRLKEQNHQEAYSAFPLNSPFQGQEMNSNAQNSHHNENISQEINQFQQERTDLMKQISQQNEEFIQKECSKNNTFDNITHSIYETSESNQNTYNEPEEFLNLENNNINKDTLMPMLQVKQHAHSSDSKAEIDTQFGDEDDFEYRMEGLDHTGIKQEASSQQLSQQQNQQNYYNDNIEFSPAGQNYQQNLTNPVFDLSNNNNQNQNKNINNNFFPCEIETENPHKFEFLTPVISHQKQSYHPELHANFQLEKENRSSRSSVNKNKQHTNISSVLSSAPQGNNNYNQYSSNNGYQSNIQPFEQKKLFNNDYAQVKVETYSQQSLNIKKEASDYDEYSQQGNYPQSPFSRIMNRQQQQPSMQLKNNENYIHMQTNEQYLQQKYGHNNFNNNINQKQQQQMKPKKLFYNNSHNKLSSLPKSGTQEFVNGLECEFFMNKRCENGAEKKIHLLSRKKVKENTVESQRFRNMKKLVMNGILKYFNPEILKSFNIPDQIISKICKIAEIIKDTGKTKAPKNKKMDLFSQPHFNALFLSLNKKSCESMSKNNLNIDLHVKIFQFDIKAFESQSQSLLNEINTYKTFMYLVAKHFLQKDSDQNEVIRVYKKIVLKSMEKMVTGTYINKFQSYKNVEQE